MGTPYRGKYPALNAVVEMLDEKPSFRNNYKNGRTFKWYAMPEGDFDRVETLLRNGFPECAAKVCGTGFILWIPKEHSGDKERSRWLKQKTGTSFDEVGSYRQGLTERFAKSSQRR